MNCWTTWTAVKKSLCPRVTKPYKWRIKSSQNTFSTWTKCWNRIRWLAPKRTLTTTRVMSHWLTKYSSHRAFSVIRKRVECSYRSYIRATMFSTAYQIMTLAKSIWKATRTMQKSNHGYSGVLWNSNKIWRESWVKWLGKTKVVLSLLPARCLLCKSEAG